MVRGGRIAECPRLQQIRSSDACYSAARWADRQRRRSPAPLLQAVLLMALKLVESITTGKRVTSAQDGRARAVAAGSHSVARPATSATRLSRTSLS